MYDKLSSHAMSKLARALGFSGEGRGRDGVAVKISAVVRWAAGLAMFPFRKAIFMRFPHHTRQGRMQRGWWHLSCLNFPAIPIYNTRASDYWNRNKKEKRERKLAVEFLQENALLFAVVIASGTILFKFAMWVQKVNSDRETFKDFMKEMREAIENIYEKIDKIVGRLDRVDARFDRVDARFDKVDARFDKVDARFEKVEGRIDVIADHIDNTTVSGASPLHLTELGEKVSSEIQARQWAEKAATEFAEKFEGKQPYEIQEFCFAHVRTELEPDDDLGPKIGMAAYEHGIDRDEVLKVLAIELRDVLMALAKQPQ